MFIHDDETLVDCKLVDRLKLLLALQVFVVARTCTASPAFLSDSVIDCFLVSFFLAQRTHNMMWYSQILTPN